MRGNKRQWEEGAESKEQLPSELTFQPWFVFPNRATRMQTCHNITLTRVRIFPPADKLSHHSFILPHRIFVFTGRTHAPPAPANERPSLDHSDAETKRGWLMWREAVTRVRTRHVTACSRPSRTRVPCHRRVRAALSALWTLDCTDRSPSPDRQHVPPPHRPDKCRCIRVAQNGWFNQRIRRPFTIHTCPR